MVLRRLRLLQARRLVRSAYASAGVMAVERGEHRTIPSARCECQPPKWEGGGGRRTTRATSPAARGAVDENASNSPVIVWDWIAGSSNLPLPLICPPSNRELFECLDNFSSKPFDDGIYVRQVTTEYTWMCHPHNLTNVNTMDE